MKASDWAVEGRWPSIQSWGGAVEQMGHSLDCGRKPETTPHTQAPDTQAPAEPGCHQGNFYRDTTAKCVMFYFPSLHQITLSEDRFILWDVSWSGSIVWLGWDMWPWNPCRLLSGAYGDHSSNILIKPRLKRDHTGNVIIITGPDVTQCIHYDLGLFYNILNCSPPPPHPHSVCVCIQVTFPCITAHS